MSAAPEVSVVLPYRDAERTLEEALRSVLDQRGVTFELIAIDDGSRDESAALVARLARGDARIRMLRAPGLGIARALEHGVAAARTAMIARMDADDVCLPGRLRAQLAFMREHPNIAALGTRVEAFPQADVEQGMRLYVAWQNALLSPEDHSRQLFVEAPLCHPSVMLRRDALHAVGGFRDGAFPEDYDLWLRLDAAGFALAKLPDVLLRWRHHAQRATLRDPRYARENFAQLKAPHLARRLLAVPRPVDVWGAGRTGRVLARALEAHGVAAARFIDIDPNKIGRRARGAPIVEVGALAAPGERWVVVALGARGARDLARAELDRRGYREGADYLCAS
jgi:glycosyltransferase involved in cell wall biosynthesis